MRKVLIANRGEIAVRIARTCRDLGIATVAVYADPDRDAPHVRLADEAFALGGDTPAASYLDLNKVITAARASGADAVHPGYGLLSENADFAEAVRAAGLTWIGPPPEAIRLLGDKVAARALARKVNARLVEGTTDAVGSAAEAIAFALTIGLPVAVKAAFGGGGRGLKVARRADDVAAAFESATREAMVAFGRGECFVERYLERPRHVETQCLADAYGNVVVVSTRDCSVQRRHQKLIEEAPAPFLSPEQDAELRRVSKALLAEAGYVGAGTCEFMVSGDDVYFLEVNARLQVEHPVTEEITGIDLVAEMLRLARGERIGYDDPPVRGHSIEFRINGEDPGRGFLPAPGTITRWAPPAGPGVRVDAGVTTGTTIGTAWDSLLAKLIVTGATREQALGRAARALAEFEVEGLTTCLGFHRAVVADPDFAPELSAGGDALPAPTQPSASPAQASAVPTQPSASPTQVFAVPTRVFAVHTQWVEQDFRGLPAAGDPPPAASEPERRTVVVEVNGRRMEISLPAGFGTAAASPVPARPQRAPRRSPAPAAQQRTLTAPMQGTVVAVVAADGAPVAEGDPVVVLEAMKMEQPVTAHRAGRVHGLTAAVGDALAAGQPVCEIID